MSTYTTPYSNNTARYCIARDKGPSKALRATFARFTRTASVMDLRPPDMTRRARCERFARRNKTCGRVARYAAVRPKVHLSAREIQGWVHCARTGIPVMAVKDRDRLVLGLSKRIGDEVLLEMIRRSKKGDTGEQP